MERNTDFSTIETFLTDQQFGIGLSRIAQCLSRIGTSAIMSVSVLSLVCDKNLLQTPLLSS